MPFELKDYIGKKIHLTGIAGSMMGGIAGILLGHDIRVSGSYPIENRTLTDLRKLGASVKGTYHKDHIFDQDLLVHTPDITDDNPELMEAKRRGIPLMERSELLGGLLKSFRHSVGVAGTHGKTSTVSILASIALSAGHDPTVLAGDRIPPMDSTFRAGSSEILLLETPEDNAAFLAFPPEIAVILNVEDDHGGGFSSLSEVKRAFVSYAALVPADGLIIANADDPDVHEVLQHAPAQVVTFGIERGDLVAENIVYDGCGRASFDVLDRGRYLFNVQLPLSGSYSVYNALAAITAARALDIPSDEILKGLLSIKGVDRRLQTIGTVNGLTFIDDYGHHPTEIRLTLESLKYYEHSRLIVCIQPQSYGRLSKFFDDFVSLFDEIDLLILLPVHGRQGEEELTSSEKLGDAIRKRHLMPTFNALNYEDAANLVLKSARPGDPVLLTGSDEVTKIHELIEAHWKIIKS